MDGINRPLGGLGGPQVCDRRWYVLKTKPRAERQVVQILGSQEIVVYLPVLQRRRRTEPLFPGYLFLKIDCRADEYLRCRSAPGVGYILSTEGVPIPVVDSLIDEIKARVDRENALGPAAGLTTGDRVVVAAGAFRGVEAIFDRTLTPQGRCLILLQILGRLTRVQVSAALLRKVGVATRP